MRGHLVGFHFCPILLSGVALFLVTFSSSLHTDLSRDEVFKRVEGITWMCYTSVITPWYFFPTFCTLLIPLYTLLATTNPSFRRNVNVSGAMGESRIGWQIFAKNSVRKTLGVTYVLLIMEEVLSIKMLNLKSKSHLYHLGRGGGEGEGGRGKGHRIFVVTISRVSQFSLVTPLNSVSDDWSYLRSLCKPGDPPTTRKTRSPSNPSFQAKNGDLFLTSAQRFSENVKFMISCLSL